MPEPTAGAMPQRLTSALMIGCGLGVLGGILIQIGAWFDAGGLGRVGIGAFAIGVLVLVIGAFGTGPLPTVRHRDAAATRKVTILGAVLTLGTVLLAVTSLFGLAGCTVVLAFALVQASPYLITAPSNDLPASNHGTH
ncbi:hypothetical protein MTX80_23420 (plasmid) [Gordonia amicalis]|nr:hypothetical protein [Gordonia amicalis]UOG23751.1 hypothetical protein MTX80_23420 [Gordonia amicalis]